MEQIHMNLIGKYKKYRKTSMQLIDKILDSYINRDIMQYSGELLGIWDNGVLIFDDENEIDVIMDFVLNEYRINNKNFIEIYRDEVGWRNKREKEILEAFISAYTSLFRIVAISESENTLILHDILNKKYNIKLIDIAFSQTAFPGLLFFIRLVPFKDFNMTSGISFVFPGKLKKYLLREYKRLSKKVKSNNESVRRFVAFFKLNRIYGIETRTTTKSYF